MVFQVNVSNGLTPQQLYLPDQIPGLFLDREGYSLQDAAALIDYNEDGVITSNDITTIFKSKRVVDSVVTGPQGDLQMDVRAYVQALDNQGNRDGRLSLLDFPLDTENQLTREGFQNYLGILYQPFTANGVPLANGPLVINNPTPRDNVKRNPTKFEVISSLTQTLNEPSISNVNIIYDLYFNILDRTPREILNDVEGVRSAVNRLKEVNGIGLGGLAHLIRMSDERVARRGQPSQNEVVDSFKTIFPTAPRGLINDVVQAYVDLLNRPLNKIGSDPVGFRSWLIALLNGTPLETVRAQIQASPEGQAALAARGGTTQTASPSNANQISNPAIGTITQANTDVDAVTASIATQLRTADNTQIRRLVQIYNLYAARPLNEIEGDPGFLNNLQALNAGFPEAKLIHHFKMSDERVRRVGEPTLNETTESLKTFFATEGFTPADLSKVADIVQAYDILLGRTPSKIGQDTDGIRYWLNQVKNGTSIQTVRTSIENSLEAQQFRARTTTTNPVSASNPTPTPLNAPSSSPNIDRVTASIAQRTGKNPSDVRRIVELYQNTLGRPINEIDGDPGVDNFINNLSAGVPFGKIAHAIRMSEERVARRGEPNRDEVISSLEEHFLGQGYTRDTINQVFGLYNLYLGRTPSAIGRDTEGFGYWLNIAGPFGTGLTAVERGISSSAEAQAFRAANPPAPPVFVPTPPATAPTGPLTLDGVTDQIAQNSGVDRGKIRQVVQEYSSILKRAPEFILNDSAGIVHWANSGLTGRSLRLALYDSAEGRANNPRKQPTGSAAFGNWNGDLGLNKVMARFDVEFYRRLYPELAGYSDQDLRTHYINHGRFEGRLPFNIDTEALLNNRPDVKAAIDQGIYPSALAWATWHEINDVPKLPGWDVN